MEKQQEQQEIKDIIANREEGFGYQLKLARNEKNLTTSDIARELRLDQKIIVAMESEDQGKLPESAFVCGYIRNYARLLGIQPEPLVEYYKREYSSNCSDPELKITNGKGIKAHSEASRFIIPLLMIGGGMFLVFGAWQLWNYIASEYAGKQADTITFEQPAATDIMNDEPGQLALPEPNKDTYVPMQNIGGSSKPVTVKVDATDSQSSVNNAGQALNIAASRAENNLSAEDSQSAEDTQSAEGSQPAEGSQLAEGSIPAEGSQLAEGSLSAEGSQPTADADNSLKQNQAVPAKGLHLEFSGDSWLVIKDANGKKLATGLKRAGQVLNLEGPAPYNVFLGNGRVVKLSINGKIFDHSRYINDKNIARFSVQ